MLDALKAKVHTYENGQLYLLWGKYYLDCPDVPRDLFKLNPQLEQHTNLLKFKPVDKNEFKEKVKLMNSKEECERILVSTFRLSDPITPDKFAFLDKLVQVQTDKLSEKALKSVCYTAIRIFIQIIYQLPQIIDDSIRTKNSKITENIISIIIFLTNSQQKKSDDFMILLIYFSKAMHAKISSIFQNSHDSQIMSSWLKLISIVLSCADSEIKLQSNEHIFTYFTSDLNLILSSNEYKHWNDKFINTLCTIFMQTSAMIPKCNSDDINNFLKCSKSLFNIFPNCPSIDPNYLIKLGLKYLETFSKCLTVIKQSNEIIQTFASNIYIFIQWVIKHFENQKNFQTSMIRLTNLPQLKELSISINLNEYFQHNATIDYTPPKFCPEMATLLDTLKSIVNNITDRPTFLTSYVAQILNVNIAKIEKLGIILPFVCELAFLFDGLIPQIINKNWNKLFVPEIFPVQPNQLYNSKVTDCCLLLLMRFFIYTENFKVPILEKIADYANNNSIVFSYFFRFLNSLLITDSASKFNISLPESKTLTFLLIKNAKTNLTYFDFLRQFANKYPSESFLSSDLSEFIVETYQLPKYTLSTLNLIEKGLSLKNMTKPDIQLRSALTLLHVLSQQMGKMMEKKSDKALEIFTLIGQKIMEDDLTPILSKMGNIFDVCSKIAIYFPDRLNEVIQLFVQVSKNSKDALNILLSPDSKVYYYLSEAMKIKSNENSIKLLLELSIHDNTTIINPRALKLVFEKLPGHKIEPELIEKLSIMCKTKDNMNQILLADGPHYIISRIETIQDKATRENLLVLYKMIGRYSFNVSLFYSTIMMIKKPTFKQPTEIINILNECIKDNIKNPQSNQIINVMGSSHVGPNILPLFTKLNGCPKCANSNETCATCGALNKNEGVYYAISILDLIANLLSASKEFNYAFLSLRLPKILVEFISQIKPIYRNSFIIDQLFVIFQKIQVPELSNKYVESVCMDFSFISSFDAEFQLYFSRKILEAFNMNQQAFIDQSIIESLLYKVMIDNTNKSSKIYVEIYNIFVNMLTALVPYASSEELIELFLSILYDNSSSTLTDSILNMILSLISKGSIANTDDSFLRSLTPLMAIPMNSVHDRIYKCMISLTQDNERLKAPMIQCAVSYNKNQIKSIGQGNKTQSTTIVSKPGTQMVKHNSMTNIQPPLVNNQNELELKLFKSITENVGKIPSLLPLWSSMCRTLSSKQEIDKAIDYILKLPILTKSPLWFYWIYTIKQIDTNTLISLLIGNAQNVKLAYDFCDVYENDTGVSLAAVKNALIEKLMNINLDIIEPNFRLFIRMAFRHLFFTEKKEIKKAHTTQLDSYLNSKLKLYSNKLNCESRFHLAVKNGKWFDLTTATKIFEKIESKSTLINKLKPIHGIHPILLFAYITYTISKFEKLDPAKIENAFGAVLENADIVTAYKAACILSHISRGLKFLQPFLEIYTDKSDSPEYQLFLFEEKISKLFATNKFAKVFKETIYTSLLVSEDACCQDDYNSIRAFCSFCDPQFFKAIFDRLKQFKSDRAQRIQTSSVNRNRLLANFMTRLQFGCGPWATLTGQIRFEMLNSVSSNGTHNLMTIVNFLSNSSDHIASKNRKNANGVYPAKLVDIGNEVIGELSLGKDSILFEGTNKSQSSTQIVLQANKIAFIFKRYFPSNPNSIEIFMLDYRSFVFAFPNKNDKKPADDKKPTDVRNHFLTQVANLNRANPVYEPKQIKDKFNFLRSISSNIPTRVESDKKTFVQIFREMKIVEKWQQNQLSNFEFIYYMNILAGNSFHVIELYPVYPLLIMGPDGNTVQGIQKYQKLTADDIAFILCRVIPYSRKVKRGSNPLKDVNEIKCGIPELYSFPAFLLNENNFNGVENVKLPAWAKNHANRYVQTLRRALESNNVRLGLFQWLESAFEMSFKLVIPQDRRYSDIEATIINNKTSLEIQCGIEFTHTEALRIRKQFCILTNGTGIDFRCDRFVKFQLPPDVMGNVLTASRSESCVIFGTKRDPIIRILHSIPTNPACESFVLIKPTDKSKMILMRVNQGQQADLSSSFQSSPSGNSNQPGRSYNELNGLSVTAASLIGDRYLLTASGDILTVWKFMVNYQKTEELVSLEELSTTSFHNDQITAIAGNAELGLIVSCDKEMNIVFETLFNSIFIRNVKITQVKEAVETPLITIFKSGTVAVIVPSDRSSLLILYDTRGKIIFQTNVKGKAVEIDKIVDNFVHESLAIGIDQYGILIFDLCDLLMKEIRIENFTGKFCVIPKSKEIIAECDERLDLFKI